LLFFFYVVTWVFISLDSAFVGLGTMIVLLPVPGWLSLMTGKAFKETMKKKDARVELVTEGKSSILVYSAIK
jgi:hypothetical protein